MESMKTTLLTVFAIGVVAFFVFTFIKRRSASDETPDEAGDDKQPATASECEPGDQCGVSCFCDDKALERQMSEEIVYYEDEDLDRYAGTAANEYTPEQIEEFSDVLTTLNPNEVADWLHSLQLRNIELPEDLKDEATMMLQQ